MAQSKAFIDSSHALNDLSTAIAKLEAENNKLHELLRGIAICSDNDADARESCPLYDEREPYYCKKERLMNELSVVSG